MSALDYALAMIAKNHLGIETLDTRHSDALDFHDVAVWQVADALRAAYALGRTAGASALEPRRDGPKKSRPTP